MFARPRHRTDSGRFHIWQAVLATSVFFAVALGAIGYLLDVLADRENEQAIRSERHLAMTAVRILREDLSNRLVDYAWWDTTAEQFENGIDAEWADESIGRYLQEQFGHAGTYGLDPELKTIYSSLADKSLPADARTFLGAPGDGYLETIQNSAGAGEIVHWGFVAINGAVYGVAGAAVTYNDAPPGPKPPVLIFFREFNPSLLEELSARYLLKGLALTFDLKDGVGVDLPGLGETDGVAVASLTWTPARPGDALIGDLFQKLAILTIVLALGAISIFVLWARSASAGNRVKSLFLAKMSHELRTPLNPIIGFSEVITRQIKGPVPDPYLEYANDIHRSAIHLQGIIEDILDFSKIESGEMVLQESELDIHDLMRCLPAVSSSTWDAKPTGEETRLPVRHEIEPDLPKVRADERRIRQVLLNLLSNAAKFSDGAEVVVRAFQRSGAVWIEVKDRGTGIDEKNVERVFQPFVQGATARNEAWNIGSGLGLAISRELMRLHGGDLTLKNRPGRGTTAVVAFPASRTVPS